MNVPKPLFGALLAGVAAMTFLAPPALAREGRADTGVVPQVPPAGDAVEGVVFAVYPTMAPGSGPILSILDGLVSIDLFGATVRRVGPDGAGIGGAKDVIATGDRVVVLLKDPSTTGGRLVALAVFATASPEGAILRGDLTDVDVAGSTLGLLGLTVRITASTVFGGDGVTTLADLRKGDPVVATVKDASGAIEATRAHRTAPVPTPVERVRGKVMTIGTSQWTIAPISGGPAIPEVIVEVSPDTKIIGSPKVGDVVEVLGRRDAGKFLATLIVALPQPAPFERFSGIVKSIATGGWTIGGPAGSLAPDRLVKVTSRTRIVGAPTVGDPVAVVATRDAAGTLTADLIARL